jgi:serine/threonine protein kinase
MRLFETVTNKYIEGRVIGNGGCGTVYQVSDDDGAIFALKLLQDTTSDKRKRFKNELAFCRKNQHERIVKVLDEGILQEGSTRLPFYVMPLYKMTLRKVMNTSLSHDDIPVLFGDILDGVEAAHLQGVIHRDLKPENLLVGMPERRIVVADFGVAHFEEEDLLTAVKTRAGDRLANYRYSAPEQRALGRPVDHRADLFALGLILNEMFTGQVPQGSDYKLIRSVAPQFGYLDEIIERMIRQDPERRPASLAVVKDQMITSGSEFVARQKLDSIRKIVVPAASPEDLLGGADVMVTGFSFTPGTPGYLNFRFEPTPPAEWVGILYALGDYRSFVGLAEPARMEMVSDKTAMVPANEKIVVEAAQMVREWAASTNREYRKTLEEKAAEMERLNLQRLRQERARLEEQARAMERLKNASLAD